jgi:hypothetical protein
MTNEGQIPMMKNMLNSAKKAGFPMSMFHCYVISTNKEVARYDTVQFQAITLRKLEIILENLKQDSEIWWIDNDIVFFDTFSNILQNMKTYPGQIVIQKDGWGFCTGYFLVRRTFATLRVFQRSIDWLRSNLNNRFLNDQHAFNAVYKSIIGLIVSELPVDEYPNGMIYFDQNRKDKARILHNNYLFTTNDKIERFKNNNMWDESDEGFNLVNKYYI